MKKKPHFQCIALGVVGKCFTLLMIFSCGRENETAIFPEVKRITASVYASGKILSVDQYDAFTNASGPIQEIFMSEGDTVEVGTPILAIYSEREKLGRESAEIARSYVDLKTNQNKLRDLQLTIDLSRSRMLNDSLLVERQTHLWKQNIGTQVELEQRSLAYENSKSSFETAQLRYEDLQKEIKFNERNATKNLAISRVLESDYILKSKIKGTLYALLKEKGEMVTPQVALAILGSTNKFILELKVDEYDISKVKLDQTVLVSMDSYKGEVFEAQVVKIYPIMDSNTKSFTIEAKFTKSPVRLYPNLTLEANIILEVKDNALIIPRSYLINEQFVVNDAGDTLQVKVGIQNYQSAEILEGLTSTTKLIKPGL